MALDLTNNPDYTNAQIVKHLRRCLVDSTFALNWTHGNQSVGRMTGDKIQALIDIYEAKASADISGTSGGFRTLLARFGNPR